MSLRALRQAVGLAHSAGHPSIMEDVSLAPSTVEAPTTVVSAVPVQEATPATGVNVPATSAGSVVVPSSTITASLFSSCSVGVATASAHIVSPPPSSAPPFVVLAMASPSSSSCPHVSLDHLYTSSDTNSLWGCKLQVEAKDPD